MAIEFIAEDGAGAGAAAEPSRYRSLVAYLPAACGVLTAVAMVWSLRLPLWSTRYDVPLSEAPTHGYFAITYDQWGHGALDNVSNYEIDSVPAGLSVGPVLVILAAVLGACGLVAGVQVWRARPSVLASRCALCACCALIGVLAVEVSYVHTPLTSIVDPSRVMSRESGGALMFVALAVGIALLGCVTSWLRPTPGSDVSR